MLASKTDFVGIVAKMEVKDSTTFLCIKYSAIDFALPKP